MSNEASWKGEFRFFKNLKKKIKLAELGPKTFTPQKITFLVITQSFFNICS